MSTILNISNIARIITGRDDSSSRSSIKSRANNYVATFPLIASDGINFEQLEAITALQGAKRALEFSLVLSNTVIKDGQGLDELNIHTNIPMRENVSTYDAVKEKGDFFNTQSLNEMTVSRDFINYRIEHSGEYALTEEEEVSFNSNHSRFTLSESLKLEDDKPLEIETKERPAQTDNATKKIGTPNAVLTRSDIDRANRDLPIILRIETRADKQQSIPYNLTMGLRTMSVSAPSDELLFILNDAAVGDKFLKKLGKIFSGDFPEMKEAFLSLFKADKQSMEIRKMRKNSRLLYQMNSMFDFNRFKNALDLIGGSKAKNYIPNMTLVLTKQDVNNLRIRSGHDILEESQAASKIYRSFMLIDLYVVDETSDTFYEYINGSWEVRRLSNLISVMNQDINKARKARQGLDEAEIQRTLSRI